ncbi:hypothetical protein DN752_17700 [Echinicola strongylocentroti]|uniref:Lipoprotein n=1 Tax=Echinicola strongylocentroti TaxID=1795355 RepID=A0A2Z4IMJ1_9BACT|nr:hypothetical protein [Echinicola strongylocentroti]AWW31816.1 hypothetical protein DN752_17700 [Echinicola strongylocentroti]
MRNLALSIFLCLILFSCQTNHYKEGLDQLQKGNTSYAIKHFIEVKESDQNYENAQKYLEEIRISQEESRKEKEAELKKSEAKKYLEGLKGVNSKLSLLQDKTSWDSLEELIDDMILLDNIEMRIKKALEHINYTGIQKEIDSIKATAPSIQKNKFPLLRKEYGRLLGKQLWRENIDVEVKARNSTTITLIGGFFASNANIEDSQKELVEFLEKLRFKRSEYKWSEVDEKYTYYSIYSKEDKEI